MGKNIILDTFIKKILEDGEKLSLQEIFAIAKRDFSEEYYNEKQIYNFIYNMKKRQEIQQTKEGKYFLVTKSRAPEGKVQCQSMINIEMEEFKEFEIINPSTRKSNKEVLSVMDSGMIAANAVLLSHFDDFCAEIRLKKDCTEIILLKDGNLKTNFGKMGRTKNYNLMEKIKKTNMKFPLYYVGEWDSERRIWHGKYLPYNPNKGKKAKLK